MRELGRGGMGVVYEARQPSLERTIALKVLPHTWVLDPRQVTRFQNEARAAATLHHPNIIPVYSVGTAADHHYYAMQLIAGASLRQVLHALREPATAHPDARQVLAGLLPDAVRPAKHASDVKWYRRAAELCAQAAAALEHAHALGVLHRDIKPGNLLVDCGGHLWVADFGLAHVARAGAEVTRSGEFLGTLAYCSPEQLQGHAAVDARSDVYSLGATLYEMLALQPPFAHPDQAALVRQIATKEPKPPRHIDPRVPRDLETITLKALAKEPSRRYQTAADLGLDLRAFLVGMPITARPVTALQRGWLWSRRNSTLAAALGVILALCALAGGVAYAALRIADDRDRVVAAEAELLRVSSQRKIDSCREAAGALRRSLAMGRRSEGLRLLRAAVAETETAATTPGERAALRAQLRSDVLATVDLWDAIPETLATPEGFEPICFDHTFGCCAGWDHDSLVVRRVGGGELARLPLPELQERHPVAAFSPRGDWLVINAETGLRLWRWDSGAVLSQPAGLQRVKSCFDRAGSSCFVGLEDGRFVVCDLERGKWSELPLAGAGGPAGRSDPPQAIAVSRDSRWLAACQADRTLRVYSLTEECAPSEIALPDDGYVLHWEEDCRHVLVGGAVDVLRIDIDSRALIDSWPGHHGEIVSIAEHRAAGLVATGGWDSQVRLWDPRGNALLALLPNEPVAELRFGSDGSTFGWGFQRAEASRAMRWRLLRPLVVHEIDMPADRLLPTPWAAFHPRAPLLAIATAEAVVFFDSESGARLGSLPMREPRRLCFLDDGTLFVAGVVEPYPDLACLLFPVLVAADEIRIGPARTIPVAARVFEADLQRDTLATCDAGHFRTTSLEGHQLSELAADLASCSHLRLAPDGRFVAMSTFTGVASAVWDLGTGARVLELPAFQRSVFVSFSRSGRLLVSSRRDELRVHAVGSWRLVATIPRQRADAMCTFATFSPDDSLLAVAATRSRLQVVETRTFTPLFEFDVPDGGDVFDPAFSADGNQLVLVSRHRKVFRFDLAAARRELAKLGLDWSDAPIPAPAAPHAFRLVLER